MIPRNTPCIWTMTDIFDDFEGFWSLVDKVSDEVEIIFLSYHCVLHESYELIIASMHITDEKCSFWHEKSIYDFRIMLVYFFGNHGTNTLVFFLYSSQLGLPAYLASWSGTPDTQRRRIVIVTHDTIPQYEYRIEISEIPSQNILSPK